MARNKKKKKNNSSQRVKNPREAMAYLNDGFQDYLSCRVLMNQGLSVQSAIFASTALEKYLKAIMAFKGDHAHGHLKKAHWNALKNHNKELYSQLDESFLKLCQKAFSLRYTESLPEGFNMVIASREFLAEIDHTINLLEKSFALEKEGKLQKLRYDHALESRDLRLYQNNHALLGIDKKEFVYSERQRVYEIRMDAGRGVVEVEYATQKEPTHPNFQRIALASTDSTSFTMAFEQEKPGSEVSS
ncbi:hypothetical protein ACXZ7B_26845 [Vibrio owensii]